MSKREGVLSWDEYFMSLALLSSQRSKDPATQVGAVIVNKNKRIIGIGYNGFPHGCSDDDLPWGKTGQWEDTKYPFGKFHCIGGTTLEFNIWFWVEPHLTATLFYNFTCEVLQSNVVQPKTKCYTPLWLNPKPNVSLSCVSTNI